jgi:hypothetical protein
MEPNWAAEHLQVIRTLMERSALYRRALAPVTLLAGVVGCGAAAGGWYKHINSDIAFTTYWLGVGVCVLVAGFALIRRQALRAAEPFWTAPTQRVVVAMAPALFVGGLIGLLVLMFGNSGRGWFRLLLPPVWMMLYGCALHAAGFFIPRGIRLFGWVYICVGSVLLLLEFGVRWGALQDCLDTGHLAMGGAFGGLHVVYGVYLYFTERRKSAL